MRRVGIVSLACLLTWGCNLGRSPTDALWLNPPLAEAPALDFSKDERTGKVIISAKEESAILDIAVMFTGKAWEQFSAWVSQTYEDGKVRWRVLEEANRH